MDKLIKLEPVVKSYIWGGTYFQKYGKSNLDIVSELWELSCSKDNSSIVYGTNKKLFDVIKKEDVGPKGRKYINFPLLIKLIDAQENLSVQVHPNDRYALKNEGSYGKCEMWYVIDADEDSGIYVGLNDNYSREFIEKKLNNGTILDCLNFFKVKSGDAFLITPGTVHAIGKGVRLLEIQQNSNLTYRLFDYKRKDKDGNYRELHLKKGLEVMDYNKYQQVSPKNNYLFKNQYFTVKKVEFKGEIKISANKDSFVSFTFINGEGMVDDIPFKKFDTFFLPYKKTCLIKGTGTVIVSSM